MNASRLAFSSAAKRSFVVSSGTVPIPLLPWFLSDSLVISASRRSVLRSGFNPAVNRYRARPPLLVLVFQRYITIDTASPGSDPSVPPPGFTTSQAKKPLLRETNHAKNDSTVSAKNETAGGDRAGLETGMTTLEATDIKDPTATLVPDEKAIDKKGERKTTVWQKVKHGIQHFWDGTKLLGAEIKISSNLALKMGSGYELSRRERRQVRPIHCAPWSHALTLLPIARAYRQGSRTSCPILSLYHSPGRRTFPPDSPETLP